MKVSRAPGWPELKVGIIVVVAIVISVFFLIKVDSTEGMFSQFSSVQARLKDLRGLRKGAPVQFSGVIVGNVNKISWDNDGWVHLSMGIKKEVRPFIKTTSLLSIESMGVLGDKYIKILPGKPADLVLGENEFVATMPEEVEGADLMLDTSDTIKSAKSAMAKLNEVLGNVSQGRGSLGKVLSEPALYDDLNRLVKTLAEAVNSPTTLGKLARDPKLYDQLTRAAEQLAQVSTAINERRGSLGKFVNESQLYDEMNLLTKKMGLLTDELTGLVKDIKERPKRYFSVSVF